MVVPILALKCPLELSKRGDLIHAQVHFTASAIAYWISIGWLCGPDEKKSQHPLELLDVSDWSKVSAKCWRFSPQQPHPAAKEPGLAAEFCPPDRGSVCVRAG